MKVEIYVELHNGAIRGNTIRKVVDLDVDPEDIGLAVEDEVLANLVGWDWTVIE